MSLRAPEFSKWVKDGVKGGDKGTGREIRVLLDAGHGGHASGCFWEDPENHRIYAEKDLALKIVELVAMALPPQVKVNRTRNKDMFVHDRMRAMTPFPYDLLLSFHAHTGKEGAPAGIHACVRTLKDEFTVELAQRLLAAASAALGIPETEGAQRLTETKNVTLQIADRTRDRHGFPISRLRVPKAGYTRPPRQFGTPAIMLVLGRLDDERERASLMTKRRLEGLAQRLAAVVGDLCPTAHTKHTDENQLVEAKNPILTVAATTTETAAPVTETEPRPRRKADKEVQP